MKPRLFTGITLIVVTALIFTGCSKVPQAEIDAANATIEQARSAGADVYVSDDFILLQDSMKSVMVRMESQNSKLIKNYTTIKEELTGVAQFGNEVAQKAENRKEELKMEIQNTVAEVKKLIETNRQLILKAPKGKEGTSALVAIKGELVAIETSINETISLFEAGDYMASLSRARAAEEKVTAINTELTEVIAKYNANLKNKKS